MALDIEVRRQTKKETPFEERKEEEFRLSDVSGLPPVPRSPLRSPKPKSPLAIVSFDLASGSSGLAKKEQIDMRKGPSPFESIPIEEEEKIHSIEPLRTPALKNPIEINEQSKA